MLRRLFCILTALFCLCGSTSAEIYSDWVRLHVVAEGDSPYQQALKMEIRDECLKCAAACIADAEDADAAYALLQENKSKFESAALRRVRELGYTGSIRAETGVFSFPDRIYGDVMLPAGEYRALRIVIGEGEGHNWWCVLYPSLCFFDESGEAGGELPPRRGLFFELFEKWRAKQ